MERFKTLIAVMNNCFDPEEMEGPIFDNKNMTPQTFPFCKTIMDYIFKNITAPQLLKLYQTCKFFYDKFRLNIIESLEISDATIEQRIVGNSMAIWRLHDALLWMNNLWITKSFTCYQEHDNDHTLRINNQKISKISYSTLNLSGEYSVEEYEFLVKSPSLRHLIIDCVIYHSPDRNYVSVEEIIERAPQVSTFDITFLEIDEPFPSIDLSKLISLKRQTKITSFYLDIVPKVPDPILVIDFFKAPIDYSNMLTFNTDGMVPQNFPFPAPIMDYIFKNITASQLLKLYQTCIFFYDKFRLNIIENLKICATKDEERIVGNSMAIFYGNPALIKLKNLWISRSFLFADYFGDYELDHGKFSRLTYNKLEMIGEFRIKDFDFLVQPSTLRHLRIGEKIYRSTKTDCLSNEEIIERAPHVSTFDICLDAEENHAAIDMTKLISSNRQTKLLSLILSDVSKVPDPLLVIEYFKKHAIPEIDYYFGFDEEDADYDEENVSTFYKAIDAELQAWKYSTQTPSAISSFIDLTGKTVVITGAADGIGRATVILFRQLGASVVAVARNYFDLKDVADECQNIENSGVLHFVSIDISDGESLDTHMDNIYYKFGIKFDILVNIADTSCCDNVPESEAEQNSWFDYHAVLQGHYDILSKAESFLTKAKGSVINVSYPDGLVTKPRDAGMVASYEQLIKRVENRLVSAGVRVNSVCPNPLTLLPRPDGMNDISYQKFLQNSKKSREEQAATAIAFLASDTGKLINGTALPANPLNLP